MIFMIQNSKNSKNKYGLTAVTEDQIPCRAYMVMTNYVLEVQIEGTLNRYGGTNSIKTIIMEILWQRPNPGKNRKKGDMLYGWLSKTTKSREEAIAVLRKRAFAKEAYLQKLIREKTEVIKQLRDDYARLSQQPGTLPCSCSLPSLNRSGCQCGGI